MRNCTPEDMFRLTGLMGMDWFDPEVLRRSEELLIQDVAAGVPLAALALVAVQTARADLVTS